MANRRRSAEKEAYWRKMLQQQQKSGLSVREFCQRKSIAEQSLYGWRKEIRRRDAQSDATNQQLPQPLVPVNIVDLDTDLVGTRESAANGKQIPPWLEVLTPNGFTVRLHHHLDPLQLSHVLSVIAGCTDGGVPSC